MRAYRDRRVHSSAAAVHGGETRQDSVRSGLEALAAIAPDIVLVHDAARPFAEPRPHRPGDRGRGALAAQRVPGMPVTDTIKVVESGTRSFRTPDRASARGPCRRRRPSASALFSTLIAGRRLQGFARFTDDGALAEWAGLPVHVFEGDPGNIKLTRSGGFRGGRTAPEGRRDDLCDPPWHGLRRACLRRRAIMSGSAA